MSEMLTNSQHLQMSTSVGNLVPLAHDDITTIVYKALRSSGLNDRLLALNLADKVMHRLIHWRDISNPLSMGDINQMVKFALVESGNAEAAKNIFEESTYQ